MRMRVRTCQGAEASLDQGQMRAWNWTEKWTRASVSDWRCELKTWRFASSRESERSTEVSVWSSAGEKA